MKKNIAKKTSLVSFGRSLLLLATLSLLFNSNYTNAQEEKGYYNWFDAITGIENTGLFNGVEYIENYRTINNKHPFLDSPDFLQGTLTYSGQTYYNQALKYHVYDDLLVIKLENRGKTAIFQLISDKVDRFSLNGRSFVHVKDASEELLSGFFEIQNEKNEKVLLKKHRRKKKSRLDKTSTYYEFSKEDGYYLLKSNDVFYSFNSKKELHELFPEAKKEINSFYNEKRALQKKDREAFVNSIFLKLSSIPINSI